MEAIIEFIAEHFFFILNQFTGIDLSGLLLELPTYNDFIPRFTINGLQDNHTVFFLDVLLGAFNMFMSVYRFVIHLFTNVRITSDVLSALGIPQFTLLEFLFGAAIPLVICYWLFRFIIEVVLDVVEFVLDIIV